MLLAPCGYKEGLSVTELMEFLAQGVIAAAPNADILRAPMVDGGEGFSETLANLTGGKLHPIDITGPIGRSVRAHVALLGGAHIGTAAIEIAAAAGLRHVPEDARDPLQTTSFGVGELIGAAMDLGIRKLIVGCGDSGVNDGGVGLAQALGIRFLDRRGCPVNRGGGNLVHVNSIDVSSRDPRLATIDIDVAVNWSNRLLGPHGVARTFGPQKGATPAAVIALEAGLENLSAVVARDLGVCIRDLKGGGASGGIGAGLHAFLGARLHPRFAILERFLDFDALLARADIVLTAEGTIDRLTTLGKLPGEIARRAKRIGVPVIALVGSVGEGAERTHAAGIDAYFSILNRPFSLQEAMAKAPELVAETTEQAIRLALLTFRPDRRAAHRRSGRRRRTIVPA